MTLKTIEGNFIALQGNSVLVVGRFNSLLSKPGKRRTKNAQRHRQLSLSRMMNCCSPN
jgi:hypothetical protein